MSRTARFLPILAALGFALAACAGPRPTGLPRGDAAYAVIPPPAEAPSVAVARTLRAGDEISVVVYREPDMSTPKATVDTLGDVALPLLGQVPAAGRTTAALAEQIAARLGQRYLRNPRVTVALVAAVPETLAVEGQVAAPGIYPAAPNATLLTSLARAGSPTQLARLDEVVVFRTVNGQRAGAVFDAGRIRAGLDRDPQLLPGDVVVVGYSHVRGAFRDFLSASPLLNVFTVF